MTDEDSENKIEVSGLKEVERRQLKQSVKESREMTWKSTEGHTRYIGGSSSQPSESVIKLDCVGVLPLKKLKF